MAEKISEKLAIEGGSPIRTSPLPWELPGSHFMGKEEIELVTRVIKCSGSLFRFYGINLQHMVDTLESEFSQYVGRKHALGVGSGTAALNIAFSALGLGPGDEVLIPGYLWVSCISGIVRCGAIPRLVEIDDTFCMSPEDMEKKIGPHTKAVLVVHMSGAPGRVEEIVKIARSKNLKIVEDCAQATGASINGRPAGSFGDIAIYSFQLNKNMSSGEGGMMVCDDDNLYKRCVAIHDLGYGRDEGGRLDTKDEDCQLWGVGSRMSELAGAVALAQFRKLSRITGAMRKAKWKIREGTSNIQGITFRNILDPQGDSGPFLIATFETPELCDGFVKALCVEGIRGPKGSMALLTMKECGLHWYFNNMSLVFRRSLCSDGLPWTHPANAFAKDYDYSSKALPKTYDLAMRSLILTIASSLTEKDIDDIVKAFKKVALHLL